MGELAKLPRLAADGYLTRLSGASGVEGHAWNGGNRKGGCAVESVFNLRRGENKLAVVLIPLNYAGESSEPVSSPASHLISNGSCRASAQIQLTQSRHGRARGGC